MQLAAITKARTLAFIDLYELNRKGSIRLTDIVPQIVNRYDFKVFPVKIEDFDLDDKGVTFGGGRLGEIVIDVLKVYSGLIYVESLSNTDDSRAVLLDLMDWGARELNFTYTPETIRQWAYISNVIFTTDFPLLRAVSPALYALAEKTGRSVSEFFSTEIRIIQWI